MTTIPGYSCLRSVVGFDNGMDNFKVKKLISV